LTIVASAACIAVASISALVAQRRSLSVSMPGCAAMFATVLPIAILSEPES